MLREQALLCLEDCVKQIASQEAKEFLRKLAADAEAKTQKDFLDLRDISEGWLAYSNQCISSCHKIWQCHAPLVAGDCAWVNSPAPSRRKPRLKKRHRRRQCHRTIRALTVITVAADEGGE